MEDLRRVEQDFSLHSRTFVGYDGPLFRSTELGRYELLPGFPGSREGMTLPPDIAPFLRGTVQARPWVGAYAPEK